MTDAAMRFRRGWLVGALPGGTVAGNLSYTAATQIANILSGTVLFIILGRILPVGQFGEIGFALTFGTMAALLPSYGFGSQAVRDVAQGNQSESAALLQGLTAQASLACLTLAGVWVYASAVSMEPERQLLVLLFSLSRIIHASQLFIGAVRRGRNDFRVDFAAAWIGTTVLVILTGTAVLFRPTSVLIGVSHLSASLVGFAVALWSVRHSLGIVRGSIHRPNDVWRVLVAGYPFAMQVIFGNLYGQVDALVVERLADMERVGYYQAAIRLVTVPFVALTILSNVYYPRVAASFDRASRRFDPHYARQLLILNAALGCLFGLTLGGFASGIALGVYGEKMSSAGPLLRILAASVPIRFVASALGTILLASAAQVIVGWSAAAAAVLNVGLSLWLVPSRGVAGAAWANLLTSALLLVVWVVSTRHHSYIWRRS